MDALGAGSLSSHFNASAAQPCRRKRPAPFSIRLTADERARLEQDAGETPLATYIKFRLFNGIGPVSRPPGHGYPAHRQTARRSR